MTNRASVGLRARKERRWSFDSGYVAQGLIRAVKSWSQPTHAGTTLNLSTDQLFGSLGKERLGARGQRKCVVNSRTGIDCLPLSRGTVKFAPPNRVSALWLAPS